MSRRAAAEQFQKARQNPLDCAAHDGAIISREVYNLESFWGGLWSPVFFAESGSRELPSKLAYEDDRVFAFHDINPQAPVHVLICPRKHIPSLNEVTCRRCRPSGAHV